MTDSDGGLSQGLEGIFTPEPALAEAVVRVRTMSDRELIKRHMLGLFEHGQPRHGDLYDPDAEPWDLYPDMVADLVEDWEMYTSLSNRKRSVIAIAITASMPTGTDPVINEQAALVLARKEFSDRERVWVAGENKGPFVKFLAAYRNEDDKPFSSTPSDLRRYRATYADALASHGVVVQATSRRSRGLLFGKAQNPYKGNRRATDG